MTYSMNTLSHTSLSDIYLTFMEAFADYVQDASHVTETSFQNRTIRGGVNLDLSVGTFANEKLVGFTLVAVDTFNGLPCAFDAGTGIIKAYRGMGIAKEMFAFIAPKLAATGVQRFLLEVLKENAPAIKAYQKAGFTVTRNLDSYALVLEEAVLPTKQDPWLDFYRIQQTELANYAEFFDWQPAWENSLSCIARIPDEVLMIGIRFQGDRAGILVYYPLQKWILCLAVHPNYRRRGIATQMIAYLRDEIYREVDSVRIINLQHSDEGMKAFLQQVGFHFTFDQHEMALRLA
jgi:ribosomal protein S18 acetylase RimI-like enzyme